MKKKTKSQIESINIDNVDEDVSNEVTSPNKE